MPPSSALRELIELKLRVPTGRLIADWVEPRRLAGKSLAALARDITATTGNLVTGSTLTRWYNADKDAGLLSSE